MTSSCNGGPPCRRGENPVEVEIPQDRANRMQRSTRHVSRSSGRSDYRRQAPGKGFAATGRDCAKGPCSNRANCRPAADPLLYLRRELLRNHMKDIIFLNLNFSGSEWVYVTPGVYSPEPVPRQQDRQGSMERLARTVAASMSPVRGRASASDVVGFFYRPGRPAAPHASANRFPGNRW